MAAFDALGSARPARAPAEPRRTAPRRLLEEGDWTDYRRFLPHVRRSGFDGLHVPGVHRRHHPRPRGRPSTWPAVLANAARDRAFVKGTPAGREGIAPCRGRHCRQRRRQTLIAYKGPQRVTLARLTGFRGGTWRSISPVPNTTSTASSPGSTSTAASWRRPATSAIRSWSGVRFLGIVADILDEFFEVRVAGILQVQESGGTSTGPRPADPGGAAGRHLAHHPRAGGRPVPLLERGAAAGPWPPRRSTSTSPRSCAASSWPSSAATGATSWSRSSPPSSSIPPTPFRGSSTRPCASASSWSRTAAPPWAWSPCRGCCRGSWPCPTPATAPCTW